MFAVDTKSRIIYLSYQLSVEFRNKVFITACNQLIHNLNENPAEFYMRIYSSEDYPLLTKALNNKRLK